MSKRYNLVLNSVIFVPVVHKRKKRKNFTPVGPHEVYEACEAIVQEKGNNDAIERK